MSRGFLKIKQNRGILDILAEVVYNRKTRKCLRQTGTSPWWKPDGCHKHKTLGQERSALKTVSRLSAADGSLLFIVQIQHERPDAGILSICLPLFRLLPEVILLGAEIGERNVCF